MFSILIIPVFKHYSTYRQNERDKKETELFLDENERRNDIINC